MLFAWTRSQHTKGSEWMTFNVPQQNSAGIFSKQCCFQSNKLLIFVKTIFSKQCCFQSNKLLIYMKTMKSEKQLSGMHCVHFVNIKRHSLLIFFIVGSSSWTLAMKLVICFLFSFLFFFFNTAWVGLFRLQLDFRVQISFRKQWNAFRMWFFTFQDSNFNSVPPMIQGHHADIAFHSLSMNLKKNGGHICHSLSTLLWECDFGVV